MGKAKHVSETPATQLLRDRGVPFTEHIYDYVAHGGTAESARALGVDEHAVVKTLVMQDEEGAPLLVLMHGDRTVSTKNLARQINRKRVEPCRPDVAQRHTGYLVGGTSPFGTRKGMPVFIERTVLDLPRILINGGRRGYLVGLVPALLTSVLKAVPVDCALKE
jgi:Cys-tRNA(Pro) deacylase